MKIDPEIAEMLRFAIKHPYTESKDIKQYQRQLASDLTITLYLSGVDGHVSLTAKQNIQPDQNSRVIKTLASLSCLPAGTTFVDGYFIRRYRFHNPLVKPPIFPSDLDRYLPKLKPPIPNPPKPQLAKARATPGKAPVTRIERTPKFAPVSFSMPPEHAEPVARPPRKEKLYWDELPADRCHICHKELTDSLSVRVSIGCVCRKHIERAEEKGPEIWDDISRSELERIWTAYNIYARRQREKIA